MSIQIIVSVVIPTVNRPHTLYATLKTVLEQSISTNYEVVVSDNGDIVFGDIEKLVNSFSDSRLRYVKTPVHYSMCDSWEFALSHARGEIICFIGDDDGLMPYAVETLIDIDNKLAPDIFFWNEECYAWPGVFESSGVVSGRRKCTPDKLYDAKSALKKMVVWGGAGLSNIPMIYHSAVKKSLINRVIGRNGRYFLSRQPDTFSGISSVLEGGTCIKIGKALSVNGWSPASNSGSMRIVYDSAQNQAYVREYGEWKTHWKLVDHSKLKFFNITTESILMALEAYRDKGEFDYNFNAMWAIFIRLSKYKHYFWFIHNWNNLTPNQNASKIIFHYYLVINIGKSLLDYFKKMLKINYNFVEAENIYEYVSQYRK